MVIRSAYGRRAQELFRQSLGELRAETDRALLGALSAGLSREEMVKLSGKVYDAHARKWDGKFGRLISAEQRASRRAKGVGGRAAP
jgi:hypothetical protein